MMNQRLNNSIARRVRWGRAERPGFSLIEALVASCLLGMVVLAVISAVTSAQSLSFEGQKQILAAMAADDLMTELVMLDYADIQAKNGLDQPVGELKTLAGTSYSAACWALGRSVKVVEEKISDPDLGVNVTGLRITVTARDDARVLATIETFIPDTSS